MTDLDLAALRATAEAARENEWDIYGDATTVTLADRGGVVFEFAAEVDPGTVLALLDRLEATEAEIERHGGQIVEWHRAVETQRTRALKAEARAAELQREMESRELHHFEVEDERDAALRRLAVTDDMVKRAAAVLAEVTGEPRIGRFERTMARAALEAALGEERGR